MNVLSPVLIDVRFIRSTWYNDYNDLLFRVRGLACLNDSLPIVIVSSLGRSIDYVSNWNIPIIIRLDVLTNDFSPVVNICSLGRSSKYWIFHIRLDRVRFLVSWNDSLPGVNVLRLGRSIH